MADLAIEPLSQSPEDKLYNEVFDHWNRLVAVSFDVPLYQSEIANARYELMQALQDLLENHPEAQARLNAPEQIEVALRYRQTGNVLLQGNPSGKEYVAITQANICMAWVDTADVDFILAKRDGCCGGKRQSFRLANEADVRRWTNKGGQ
jgi:hypothetical protein